MLCLKNIKGQNNTELLSNQKKKEKKRPASKRSNEWPRA